jgi:hypothetical protein
MTNVSSIVILVLGPIPPYRLQMIRIKPTEMMQDKAMPVDNQLYYIMDF